MSQSEKIKIVQFSGGIGSWAVARRIADRHGVDDLVLLFADVKTEDDDLYRFNRDAAEDIGIPLVVVSDGRTPQQVLRDNRWLGSSRIAPCSHLLKQRMCRQWLKANTDPAETVLYVGIDWSEIHRLPAIQRNWAPWNVEAPLTQPPYRDKYQLIHEAKNRGLTPPRLYGMGFPHNNCGGACVRAGQAQWAHLLREFPERFASWEEFENEMRIELGDVAILRDRRGGETRPLPLSKLREMIESRERQQPALDIDDWGGCGCMTEKDEYGYL